MIIDVAKLQAESPVVDSPVVLAGEALCVVRRFMDLFAPNTFAIRSDVGHDNPSDRELLDGAIRFIDGSVRILRTQPAHEKADLTEGEASALEVEPSVIPQVKVVAEDIDKRLVVEQYDLTVTGEIDKAYVPVGWVYEKDLGESATDWLRQWGEVLVTTLDGSPRSVPMLRLRDALSVELWLGMSGTHYTYPMIQKKLNDHPASPVSGEVQN